MEHEVTNSCSSAKPGAGITLVPTSQCPRRCSATNAFIGGFPDSGWRRPRAFANESEFINDKGCPHYPDKRINCLVTRTKTHESFWQAVL